MSGLVPNKPTVSAPDTPPPAPTVANSQSEMDAAARQTSLKLQRGLAATRLTGGAGLKNAYGTASSTLLGRGAL